MEDVYKVVYAIGSMKAPGDDGYLALSFKKIGTLLEKVCSIL